MIATLSRAGALTKLVAGAICVRTCSRSIRRVRAVVMGMGRLRRGNARNLLSDHLGFVVCLDLEAAVVGPEVNGNADASDAALVDLPRVSSRLVYSRLVLLTISAASVPAIANSKSAYLFQNP
jgi:hypothetical protein